MIVVDLEGGKYVATVENGRVSIARYGDPAWLVNPPGAKAWIAAIHEIDELRGLVEELKYGGSD